MTIVDEAVAASEDSAAPVYDEREYLTQHGSTSGATVDPVGAYAPCSFLIDRRNARKKYFIQFAIISHLVG